MQHAGYFDYHMSVLGVLSLTLFLPLLRNPGESADKALSSVSDPLYTYALCGLSAITPLLMDGLSDAAF